MKIKFALGPYGYEIVLGNITEKIYNKYSQDNDALRDAVTGFEEDPEIKEWSDMDDIAHNYGAVLEEEGTDQYLKIVNELKENMDNIDNLKGEIEDNLESILKFVDKNFNQSEVVNNVIRAVIDYFDVKKWSMGDDIFVSNLVEIINNVGGVLNLVNFQVNNLVGGNYSNNRTNQTTISFDDQSIPAVYGLDMSDYTIFGQNNGMFEIKYPNRDISVRVKTN